MGSRLTGARTAGILYLVVAALPLGTLAILLIHTPEISLRDYFSAPGMKPLLATLIFLGASSVVMGALLVSRTHAARYHFAIGVLIAGVAFTWNIIAPLFWVLPLLFTWQARTRT